MADIPGLIEGASEGRGLGIQFLAHVERCKVLLHLVDGTSSTITKDFKTIVTELEAYSEVLGDKARIVALNKTDAMDAKQISDRRRALEKAIGWPGLRHLRRLRQGPARGSARALRHHHGGGPRKGDRAVATLSAGLTLNAPDIRTAKRLVVKIGSALLVDRKTGPEAELALRPRP